MPRERLLRIYCDWRTRRALERGERLMAAEVSRAFRDGGWQVAIVPDSERAGMADEGYHLVINQTPPNLYCLNLRSAYLPAFWRIEETNDRTLFSVAGASFDPSRVDAARARGFADRWRAKVLGDRKISRDGFIFMPLQDQLLTRRRFQTMSPVEMIRATLEADPTRTILATLHPRESYDDESLSALAEIAAYSPRFELSREASPDLLCRCDYVVTQTSGMGFEGFFAAKPAVLFGRIDFHHIGVNVWQGGVAGAFRAVKTHGPDYDAYLAWFLRRQAMPQADAALHDRIRARCRQLGWPI